MNAELLFHFIMCSMIAGCMLACGIAAIIEVYNSPSERRYRKRRAKAFLRRTKYRRYS